MQTQIRGVLLVLTALLARQSAFAASDELQAALRLTPNLGRGSELFETCAACHGPKGLGAPDGSVPAIAGQPTTVLLEQTVDFRNDARVNVRMHHFVDRHHLNGPQDLADVAAYIHALPPRPPSSGSAAPPPEGARLYARYCRSCHGAGAEGSEQKRIPRLAAQHPEYLEQQLRDAAEGQRPSMEATHTRRLMPLNNTQLEALAAYLAALPPGR